jgi:hypothetical protein
MGKITGVVAERARRAGVPVLVVAGTVDAALPDGVYAVDGGGRTLAAGDLAELAGRGAARLLAV